MLTQHLTYELVVIYEKYAVGHEMSFPGGRLRGAVLGPSIIYGNGCDISGQVFGKSCS